jgi:hypothetical protein
METAFNGFDQGEKIVGGFQITGNCHVQARVSY